MRTVKIEIDVRTAAAVRQVLYDHQIGHSYKYPSERITDIRSAILELDNKIEQAIKE